MIALLLMQQIAVLFLIMGLGFLIVKLGIVETEDSRVLSMVTIYLVLPCVTISGLWLHAPFLVIFACCFVDEPVRFTLMLRHLFSGRWVRPVTPAGQDALPAFRAEHARRKEKE